MTNPELILAAGFEEVDGQGYTMKIREIPVLLLPDNSVLDFVLYCTPSRGEPDHEIDHFLRQETAGSACIFVSYSAGMMELKYGMGSEEYDKINLRTALEVIRQVTRKFDMLPACALCHRNGEMSVYYNGKTLQTVCDVCRGEDELRNKHQRIIENSRASNMMKTNPEDTKKIQSVIETNPLHDVCIASIKTALLTMVVSMVLFLLGQAVSFFSMLHWLTGGIAGFYLMRKLLRIDYMATFTKTIIGSLITIVLVIVISFINSSIVMSILWLGSGIHFVTGYLQNSFFIIVLAVSLGGFFLGEAAAYFTNTYE